MPKKNESANKIIDAFISLVQTRDYDSISISDITNKAGVSRISFYRNFLTKEDIVGKFIERVLQETVISIQENFSDSSLESYLFHIFSSLSVYSSVITELCNADRSNMILKIFNENLFKTPLAKGNVNFKQYEKLFYSGACFNVFLNWILSGMTESGEEIAHLCSNLILN